MNLTEKDGLLQRQAAFTPNAEANLLRTTGGVVLPSSYFDNACFVTIPPISYRIRFSSYDIRGQSVIFCYILTRGREQDCSTGLSEMLCVLRPGRNTLFFSLPSTSKRHEGISISEDYQEK